LSVTSKSLFLENTLTFINNYILLLNIIENTILLSFYTGMNDILTVTRIIEWKPSVSLQNHGAYVKKQSD